MMMTHKLHIGHLLAAFIYLWVAISCLLVTQCTDLSPIRPAGIAHVGR